MSDPTRSLGPRARGRRLLAVAAAWCGLVVGSLPVAPAAVSAAGAVPSAGGATSAAGGVTSPLPGSGFGELRVTTSPAVPSVITVDGTVRDVWGQNWLDIEAGTHEVCFGDVAGHTTPPCATVDVPDGGTATHEGTFTPLATIQVTTDPPLPATITINTVPRNDWGVYTWFPPTIAVNVCFGPVADWTPPPCQNIPANTVGPGGHLPVTGTYTPTPGAPGPTGPLGTLRVTTTPAVPTTIRVDGTRRDDWGLNWLKLAPDTYEICFTDIPGHTTPPCQDATITNGQTTEITATFTPLGYIQATTDPPWDATITIDGIPRNDWGAWPPITNGAHEVCFRVSTVDVSCSIENVANGKTTAVTAPPPRALAVTAGNAHTCAIRPDRTVACWGFNGLGQLGDGTTFDRGEPVTVVGITDVVDIAAGDFHSCAVHAGGTVSCWGNNGFGELGDGTTSASLVPVPVVGITNAIAVSAGYRHNCALLSTGRVRCWGRGTRGQLGDGVGDSSSVPVAVAGSQWVQVVGGSAHTCARRSDGVVACWGGNGRGQLGDGTTDDRLTPTAVSGGLTATALGGGSDHTCLIMPSTELRCWGENTYGKLGAGPGPDQLTPVPAAAIGLVSVDGGEHFTCGRAVDSTLTCWGRNVAGQLGDTTLVDRIAPVVVAEVQRAVSITAGDRHACALVAGRVWCWGYNGNGLLGRVTPAFEAPLAGPVTGL